VETEGTEEEGKEKEFKGGEVREGSEGDRKKKTKRDSKAHLLYRVSLSDDMLGKVSGVHQVQVVGSTLSLVSDM